MSIACGIYMTALPFVVVQLGGSDKDVGICSSLGAIGYFAGLLLFGRLLEHFNAKTATQIGALGATLSHIFMWLAVIVDHKINPILLVT